MRLPSLALFVVVLSVTSALGQTPQGSNAEAEGLYTARCASCHDAGVARAPNRQALNRLSPDAIRAALTSGSMRSQGAELTPAQIEALARTLGTATTGTSATSNTCSADATSTFAKPLEQPNWNGWGANISQHRF